VLHVIEDIHVDMLEDVLKEGVNVDVLKTAIQEAIKQISLATALDNATNYRHILSEEEYQP